MSRRRNRLMVEINLFEELPWTRAEPGFTTSIGSVGMAACRVHIAFDYPGMVSSAMHIVRAHTDLGWADENRDRMRRVYREGLHVWQYVNLVANRMLRWRAEMEKRILTHTTSSRLNQDALHYLLEFI